MVISKFTQFTCAQIFALNAILTTLNSPAGKLFRVREKP